ncbi:hypothetical protein [Actinokineospora sp. UTMC 2448]|uniref:hypothetical protein n=1 Tax=Actinokineospora sp. UTMC 2448 TaxID=2268449 RepID=UPI0021642F83|nr:hypothetical protein [Actinokineospora sp. UTMC 2448]UVS78577.1 hypothetical protein Actkin_02311 [Actinokineospora sp. UTMC 2448]
MRELLRLSTKATTRGWRLAAKAILALCCDTPTPTAHLTATRQGRAGSLNLTLSLTRTPPCGR